MAQAKARRRRWRFYATASGNQPVREFLDSLPPGDAAEIAAAMRHVRERGTMAARHLRGDIWEVRVIGENRAFRILFSVEGRLSQILLALEGYAKKTQKTPAKTIDLAERRLLDWRGRARVGRNPQK